MTRAITLCESNNEARIEWSINNFFIREDNLIISPDFILFNSKWFLMLHLGSKIVLPFPQPDNVFREPLRMSILTPYSKTEHHIECRMGIQRSDGSEIRTETFESLLKPGFNQMPQRRELISRKDFENSRDSLVLGNTLKIFCVVRLLRVGKPAKDVSFRTPSYLFRPPIPIFCDEEQMAGDITLDESKNETRIAWRINDFFNREDCSIQSQDFILFKTSWYLEIHKFSFSQKVIDPRSSLRMSLHKNYDKTEHYIEYRMGIQRSDGSEITTEKCESILQCGFSSTYQEHKLISRKDLESSRDTLVPGNYLKVFCIARLLSDNNSVGEASLLRMSSSLSMSFGGSRLGQIILSQSKNETRIEWMINHFFQRETSFMTSPNFILFKSNWFLEISKCTIAASSLFHRDKVSEKTLDILLQRDCYSTAEHHIEYKMGIQRPDGTEVISETFESVFQPRFRKGNLERKLISGKDFENLRQTLAHASTLKIFCTVRLLSYENSSENISSSIATTDVSGPSQQINQMTPVIDSSPICGSSQNKPGVIGSSQEKDTSTSYESSKDVCICKGNHTLSENFEALFRSKRLTDVTITVKNKIFHAHKLILSTRSDVFASMFVHDTSEERSGVVEITDCDPDSFEDFLLYLYAGKLNSVSSTNAVSLYKTADKYGVGELRDECIRCMSRKMTVDTFCDVFHLAVLHGESELLATATSFFIRNASSVLITKEWMTLLEEHPSLCNELLVKFAKSGLHK